MKHIQPAGMLYRYRIELVTFADIQAFVKTACKCKGRLLLCSGKDFQINAQSMLGVILAKKLNWNELTLVTEHEYYNEFKDFMVD